MQAIVASAVLLSACSATTQVREASVQHQQSSMSLLLIPSNPEFDQGKKVMIGTWQGTSSSTIGLGVQPRRGRVAVRVVCGHGSFSVHGASGHVIFGGDCDPALIAGGTAPASLFGTLMRLDVEAGVKWVADVWRLTD